MGFKDFEGFSFKHVNNPLNPNTDQRSNFDSRGDELAAYIKSFIIDVLNSTAKGTSGADNLGATPITDGAPSTTQGVLSWLYTQILEVSRAGVADGAITDSKLADKDIQIFTDAIINNIKFSNVDTNTVLMGLKGRTIINLLGSDGDCEDISKWTALSVTLTLDSTTKVFGNNSIKVTNTSTAWGNANKNIDNIVDKTKYYCFSVYAKPGQSSGSSILLYNGAGDIGTSVSTAKTTDITKFTRVFLKVKPSDFGASGNILKSSALDNVAGSYANIDGVMINEITEAEYNGSSYVPPEYVNDDTSVVNPVIVSSGKNKFNKRDANITYGKYISYITGELSTNVSWAASGYIRIKPNQKYTTSGGFTSGRQYAFYDKDKIFISGINQLDNFITPANAEYIRVSVQIVSLDVFQLEEGDTATTYEPYFGSSFTIPYTLRSIKAARDEFTQEGLLIQNVRREALLDFNFSYVDSGTGFKRIRVPLPATSYGANDNFYEVYNNNNKKLAHTYPFTAGDQSTINVNLLEVYISISQADSGWGDTYTPLAEEQKAMMKGYKMNNGTFGQAYNGTGTKTWTTFDATSNTGSVTVCPTGIAANWVGYKLHYQLKSPVITKISPIELKIPTNGSIHIYSTINPYVNYTHFKNLKAMLMTLISSLSDVSSKLQDNNKKIDDVAFIVPDSANVIMQNSELFTHIGNPDNSNPDILKNIFVPNAGRYKITFEARKALGTAPTTINLMLNSVKYNTSLLGYTIQSFSLPSTQTTFTTFSCTMDVPIPAYDIIAVTASSSSGTTEIRNITLLGVPGDKSEGVFK